MPDTRYRRSKIIAISNTNNSIYSTVGGWYENTGGVDFIAWAIQAGQTATALGNVTTGNTGGGATTANHPDQLFWLQNGIQNKIARIGVQNILRIEIDCSLLPCADRGPTSCLFQVPRRLQNLGLGPIPLWFFSHRNEHMATADNNGDKRKIETTCNAADAALTAAYNTNIDWMWTSP